MTACLAHLPFPATYGQRPDGTFEISFGRDAAGKAEHGPYGPFPADVAAGLLRIFTAYPLALIALEAVRRDCRDPDTDTALAPATGELVEAALAAMGDRS